MQPAHDSGGRAASLTPCEPGRAWPEIAASAAIVGLAFALRASFIWAYRDAPLARSPVMDELYHLEWARSFAEGRRFVEGPYFRAPLYPAFLGSMIAVFGEHLTAVRLVQAGLGALCTWLVLRLGRELFGRAAGLLAGALYATAWVAVFYDSQLLVETLAVPLYTAALYAGLRALRGLSSAACAATGLALGLGAITRPNVLLFVPVALLGLVLAARRSGRPALRPVLACFAGLALAIAPVSVRNACVGGEAVLISTQAGVNLWIGNNPASDGITAVVPGTREDWWGGYHDAIALAEREAGRELRASEVSRHYLEKSWTWARSDPAAWTALFARKLRYLLVDWELPNNEEPRFLALHYAPWMGALPQGFGALLALAGLGLFFERRRWREHWLLWTFLLTYSASVVAFFVNARFRLPLLPPLAVYAGAGLCGWLAALRQRRFAVAFATLAAALVLFCSTRTGRADFARRGEANGWLVLGQAHARAGDAAAAVDCLQRSVAIEDGSWIAWRALGSLLLGQDRPHEAREALERALALRPKDVVALETLGDLYLKQGAFAPIEDLARRLEAAAPDSAKADYLRGRAALAAGQLASAEELFRRGSAADPNDWRASYALGVLLESRKEDSAARAAFQQSLEALERLRAAERTPEVERFRSDLLLRLERPRGAVTDRP